MITKQCLMVHSAAERSQTLLEERRPTQALNSASPSLLKKEVVGERSVEVLDVGVDDCPVGTFWNNTNPL